MSIGILGLIILPCLAFAADNASIAVSCSIPAVPGLNAPASAVAQVAEGQASEGESPETLEEEVQGLVMLANGKIVDLVTQTVYSR